jgi:hypothetical protein
MWCITAYVIMIELICNTCTPRTYFSPNPDRLLDAPLLARLSSPGRSFSSFAYGVGCCRETGGETTNRRPSDAIPIEP